MTKKADEEKRRGGQRMERCEFEMDRKKMKYNKKVLALRVVCLSPDTNREPMIHRHYYCQTELRLCSLAYASLIMQIRSVRQNITPAVSQSGFRR